MDINVLVSTLISRHGAPGEILVAWEKGQFDLVAFSVTLDELGRVLHYPKIQKKYNLSTEHIEVFLHLIRGQAIVVHPTKELTVI